MEQYEPIAMVQKVQVSHHHYNALRFYQLLGAMSAHDFDKFCARISQLSEFYYTNIGAICTDQVNNIKDMNDAWTLKEKEGDEGTDIDNLK